MITQILSRLILILSLFFSFPYKIKAQTVPVGYQITTLATGVNTANYKIACDPINKYLYTTGNNTIGYLQRITYGGALSTISLNWATNANAWHPYIATQVKFFNGDLYTYCPNGTGTGQGKFIKLNPSNGTPTVLSGLLGVPGYENGVEMINDTLWGVNANNVNEIVYYDLTNNVGGTKLNTGVSSIYSLLAYDNINDKLYYYRSGSGIYLYNRFNNTLSLVSGTSFVFTDFAIAPLGNIGYLTESGTGRIFSVNLNSGSIGLFATLPSSSYGLCFGPSSIGDNSSLFVITSSGVIYEIQRYPYQSTFTAMSTGSATWCAGETRTVSVTVTNIGTATWTNTGPDVNIGATWSNDLSYPWRVNANNLAPGQSQTYNITVTAPASPGSYTLQFDVVKEGDCWFGSNTGSCGPGNAAYVSAAQTVSGSIATASLTGGSICSPATGANVTLATSQAGVNYQLYRNIFKDDFETFTGWGTYGTGVVAQSSAVAQSGTRSLIKTTNGDPNGGIKAIGQTVGNAFMFEGWLNRTVGSSQDRLALIDASGNGYGIRISGTQIAVERRAAGVGTDISSLVNYTRPSNQWYRFVFLGNGNGTYTLNIYNNAGVLQASVTSSTDNTYSSFTQVAVLGGFDYHVDNIRLSLPQSALSGTGNALVWSNIPVGEYQAFSTNTSNCSRVLSSAATVEQLTASTWYLDADNDGWYVSTQTACTSPGTGWTSTLPTGGSGDCDDNNAAINPAATEICGNSIDDNCNNSIDEDCSLCATTATIAEAELILLCNPQTRTLTVNFDGDVDAIQWYRRGQAISGATTANLLVNRWTIGDVYAEVTCNGNALESNRIFVNSIPVRNQDGADANWTKICNSQPTTLSVPLLAGHTYLWRERGTNTVVSTTHEFTVSGAEITPHRSYDVFVTSTTGCTKSTKLVLLSGGTCLENTTETRPETSAKTSMTTGNETVNLMFYPNPVTDKYVISLSGLSEDENFAVNWYDITGKQVKATEMIATGTGREATQNIGNLAKGIYVVKVDNANHQFTFRVMVQ